MRRILLAGAALTCLICGNASAGLFSGLTNAAITPHGLELDAPATGDGNSVNPFYGNINPFYGAINPFYGGINPFYGDISPFWGDIDPFWGDINPFYGNIDPFYGAINPFWGTINPFDSSIQPFWKEAGPEWGAINSAWTNLQSANATDYSGLQTQLKAFLNKSADFWGAAVRNYTGKDFADGFENQLLAKYGINPDDPSSLANTDARTRSAFFLAWYDGLMSFTGVDHVDWWMSAVNWSPSLADTQGSAGRAVVGILDSTFTGTDTGVDSLTFVGGYTAYVNDHGAAVASLIAAKRDGKAIMGVAPNSDVLLYNPFDQTGTANWQDVQNGIYRLYQRGAHVVNASLGVPGVALSKEWVDILTGPLLSTRRQDLVIVKAAGNEGMVQSQNVPWLTSLAPPQNLLIVGSVGPTGQISSFSNTPGEACLTLLGICTEQNKLKYRYLVAPGELMLVSDGHGGVTRMSGTSFAAPLVTGAIALLQDRWPWLQQHAPETVQIILQSAKDLGAPGVDPIYGWGELDIQASQSPLNFDNLVVFQPFSYDGNALNPLSTLLPNWSARQLKQSVLNPGQLDFWQNQKAYLVAFEPIGSTFRDFTIPLSSLLVGKNQKTAYGENPFQSYLYQRMIDWAHGSKFSDFASRNTTMGDGAWSLGFSATDPLPEEVRQTGIAREHYEFELNNAGTGIGFRLGEGNGAHGLMTGIVAGFGHSDTFSLATDFDPATGGVNPILGLASGGAYAQGSVALGAVHFSAGFSQKSDNHTYYDPVYGPMQTMALPASSAEASMLGMDYNVTESFAINASYTSLNENDGLLGAQGGGVLSFPGAHTDAATLGATAKFGGGWEVAASATAGTTAMASANSALSLAQNGMRSTAYEVAATKSGLFTDGDRLRLSIAQPLHIESGTLIYRSVEVVDRQTGALGPVTQRWNVSGNRENRFEALYAMPVLDGRAEVAGFGQVDVNGPETQGRGTDLSIGTEFSVKF